jgi:RNA recognition motif-containing protein
LGTKIRISNLPLQVDSGELEDMFMSVGNVVATSIDRDQASGVSLGIGFVEMASEEEMRNCVEHFNGQNKQGNRLSVREDKPHVAVAPVSLKAQGRRKTFASAKTAFGKKSKGKKQ